MAFLADKETLGWLSVIFTVIGTVPYYYFVFANKIKPHAFSWFIWGVLTAIGFAAQYTEGAGPGAWATGSASVACLSVAALALFKGERHITVGDWASFVAALAAIPLWYVTSDPLGCVILVSAIDTIGYYPTFRKSYHKPHEELIFTHFMGTIKYVLGLLAMEQWSVTTWLYPAAISAANIVLIAMLVVRRRALAARASADSPPGQEAPLAERKPASS